ncbi:MAG: Uma2 family endonuclease [Pseudomonadota bacterium]
MGFRLALPNKTAIRRPDLGVVCNNNPVSFEANDRTYRGVCDMCIEALSDSTKEDKERDTVTKKQEYAASVQDKSWTPSQH